MYKICNPNDKDKTDLGNLHTTQMRQGKIKGIHVSVQVGHLPAVFPLFLTLFLFSVCSSLDPYLLD